MNVKIIVSLLSLSCFAAAQDGSDLFKRQTPPSRPELSKARENLTFIYQSDYDKIKSLSGNATQQKYARMVLSRKLWDNAKTLKPSDSGFYPTLYEVMRLSVVTQKPKPALEAIALMEKHYAINSTQMRTIVFENAVGKGVRLDDVKAASEYLNHAIQVAVLNNYLEDAKKLITAGEAVANRILNRRLQRDIKLMGAVVNQLWEQEFQAGVSQRKIDRGEGTQDDYVKLALYIGLRKNNWNDAEILAGELKDEKLREMFVKEILADRDLATTIELANGWWEFASNKTGAVKSQAIELAAFRYAISISKLEGFNKQIAESRLKLVNKQLLLTRLWQVKDYGNLGFLWEGAFDTAPGFLTNGLIAYYPFNGNSRDASPNQNDALLKNGASIGVDRFGNKNSALELDGKDDYAEATHRDYLNFPKVEATISFWSSVRQFGGFHFVGKNMGVGSKPKWHAVWAPNLPSKPRFCLHIMPMPPGQQYFGGVQAIIPNTWSHFLITNDSKGISVYFNGKFIGKDSSIKFPQNNTAPLTIGQAEGEGFVNGSIDDIRIYNRALSAEEVKQLYEYEK